MSEAKRGRGRREQPTVSIHLRVSPLEAELIDLRLAYMAEDAASKNGKPMCKTRPELLRYLLQDVEFLGRPFPHAGPWRERAERSPSMIGRTKGPNLARPEPQITKLSVSRS